MNFVRQPAQKIAIGSVVLACVLMMVEVRAVWGSHDRIAVALSLGAIAAYAAISVVVGMLDIGRLQPLFAFAVGFGVAALGVLLTLFPDGFMLLAGELKTGLPAMEQVGFVLVAIYFAIILLVLGSAFGIWFLLMTLASRFGNSPSDRGALPRMVVALCLGWIAVSASVLLFRLVGLSYIVFSRIHLVFWLSVLGLSLMGLFWASMVWILRTKW